MTMRFTTFLLAAALPGAAAAEGARLELDCTFVTACEATGPCAPGDGPARFVVEPEAIEDDGTGLYTLWVDDGEGLTATGASRTGPFAWTPQDDVRMQLALTGESSALWIRQTLDTGGETPAGAEIDLMTCEVTF